MPAALYACALVLDPRQPPGRAFGSPNKEGGYRGPVLFLGDETSSCLYGSHLYLLDSDQEISEEAEA
jgi:hypothetical protein